MAFLKKNIPVEKKQHSFTITVTATDAEAAQLANDIQQIVSNISPDDMSVIANASRKKLLVGQAMKELRKYV